jgi:hypothetical protein
VESLDLLSFGILNSRKLVLMSYIEHTATIRIATVPERRMAHFRVPVGQGGPAPEIWKTVCAFLKTL